MNYLDYREKLGIGLNDKEIIEGFENAILSYFDANTKASYSRDTYLSFCSKVGIRIIPEVSTMSVSRILSQPKGFQIVVPHFEAVADNFKEFLVYCIAFFNTYTDDAKEKEKIRNYYFSSIENYKLMLEPLYDKDGMFLFPKGAQELDDALVSEPLEWLRVYPKTHATFSRALKQYSDGEYARDVADNFRKALEGFLKEYLESDKDFDENRKEICRFLKSKGADKNITNMLEPMLAYYKKLNDDQVKHNDKLNPKLLEYIMYQTGLFIRMIITIGKEENSEKENRKE